VNKQTLSRRDFLRMSVVTAAGVALTACAAPGAAPAAQEGEAAASTQEGAGMVFWPEWGGKDADALQAQVKKFTDETGITVDYLPIRDHARMIASMGAGNPPDLLMTWDSGAIGTWAFNEAIIDLKPHIEASGFDLETLHPLGVASGDLMGIKQIGLPLSNYLNTVLYWNKDAFANAELDPETPPATWQEARAMADKITVVEDGQIKKWGFQVYQGQMGHPSVIAYAFGGDIYSPDRRQVTPDSEGMIQMLEWIRSFYSDYTVAEVRRWTDSITEAADSPTNPIYTGDAAMLLTGEWMPSFIERIEGVEVNVGAAYMPYPEAKPELKGTMAANSNPMIIPSDAKNPDAGWQFIEFISRPENSAEMCVIVGNASPVKEGVKLQAAQTESPLYKWMLEDVWVNAKILPLTVSTPVGSLYSDALAREIELVLALEKEPLEAMQTVKEEIQPELDAALEELGM
jgi:multiple sugar transport system substrate-binding protein